MIQTLTRPNAIQPDPRKDKADVWYSPAEINNRYTWEQNIWMIINILPLPAGEWLADPRASGYVGSNHLRGSHALYEDAACVRSTLESRIKRTKLAGKLLVVQLQNNLSLEYDTKMALAFCCGRKEKVQSYSVWKAKTEDRRKRYKNISNVLTVRINVV